MIHSFIHALVVTAAASNLNATDESLTATTTSTAATDITVNYVEFTTSSGANIGSGEQVTNFTTATTSTILAAPAAGTTTRSPSFIKACNKGTSSQTVTIQYVKTAGSLSVRQAVMSLNAGECGTVGNDGTVNVATVGGVQKTAGQPDAIGGRSYSWSKTATATDAAAYGYVSWKDAGRPGAYSLGTPGVDGVATDCSVVGTAGSGGALSLGTRLFTNAASGSLYLRSISLSAQAIGAYQLVDVLWYNTGLVVTTTTAQAITTPAFPARDSNGSSNGYGLEFGTVTTTANTNAAVINNSTFSYTDADGTPGGYGHAVRAGRISSSGHTRHRHLHPVQSRGRRQGHSLGPERDAGHDARRRGPHRHRVSATGCRGRGGGQHARRHPGHQRAAL
jgi:hypothetical protein